ncbi:MAG: hypothetical protein A2X12_03180 [Bacteroidetes bacterium GWE2_29_8]|nr:MAG: hypothetical protein A2X12_03180 [Bacteroidetes bacterium GWE2_29_8]OFY22389.1 MAG: hypothetical protein A2X02_01945 [Bacteroidetes bacterium GWF2_29_10]
MGEKDLNTEEVILNAAKKVFVLKGFDGAKMQDISNEAGINKALLHYYYRSKENLFDAVFLSTLHDFLPKIGVIMNTNDPFQDRLKMIINVYIDMLQKNPHFPIFLFHEVNRNPERLVSLFKEQGKIDPKKMETLINNGLRSLGKKEIKVEHLMSNILGMCLFPFIARPILEKLFFNNDVQLYNEFLEERRTVIYETIINFLNLN